MGQKPSASNHVAPIETQNVKVKSIQENIPPDKFTIKDPLKPNQESIYYSIMSEIQSPGDTKR